MTPGRRVALLLGLFVAALAVLALAPLVGTVEISLARAFDGSIPADGNRDAAILFNLRLPRVACAATAGALLALAGLLTQGILRNDLATPYTMGISSGAAVGSLIAIQLGGPGGPVGTGAAAFAGAAATMLGVLAIARRMASFEASPTLVLIGVTVNILLGSVILVIQYLADPFETFLMLRWLMGAVDVTGWTQPTLLFAAAVAALLMGLANARRLDALELGDLPAHSLGVDPARLRLAGLALASAATAVVVSACGPIGFVGLLVPHAMRHLFGRAHAYLLPASALAGAAFLTAADAVARGMGGSIEVPVGIVTSLVGGPLFLALLARRTRG